MISYNFTAQSFHTKNSMDDLLPKKVQLVVLVHQLNEPTAAA